MNKGVDVKTDKCKHCGATLAHITNTEGKKLYQKHSCPRKPQFMPLSARWGIV